MNAGTNTLQATLVELKASPDRFKISGNVSNLQSASKTFQIDRETISYAGSNAADIAPGLSNGVLVKVRLAPSAPMADGAWTAALLRKPQGGSNGNNDRAQIEGLVTSLTSPTLFSVSGVSVDARSASFPNGSAGLLLGARVEVKGTLVDNTLVANEVKLQQSQPSGKHIELSGKIASVDSAAKTFMLRGVTVGYGATVRYDNGSESQLTVDADVEVKGQSTPNSSVLSATSIKFKN